MSFSLFANSQFNFSCPDKFEAKVTKTSEVIGDSFLKNEVHLNVEQSIKGTAKGEKVIQVVANGPITFLEGKTYVVEMRDGWLCNANLK